MYIVQVCYGTFPDNQGRYLLHIMYTGGHEENYGIGSRNCIQDVE